MSRPFRPRPLDIHKKLPIVKSVKDLDIDEVSRSSLQSNGIGYAAESDHARAVQAQHQSIKRRVGEIPTPQCLVVESYERDYQRTFIQPSSYVRGRGSRTDATEVVEYDLDDQDDDWLLQYNKEEGEDLSPESFEWMLYKLEILDYKARERAGAIPAVFGVPVPVLLQQDAAYEVLRSQNLKQSILSAAFDYWKSKRERWQKPILRRLQPPPPINDTNPFNVFRPREKTHRPHTRRTQRRENDVTSFEKLRQVHFNLEQAKTLLEIVKKREEKKRELLDSEASIQRMRIIMKHDTDLGDELIMAESPAVTTPFPLSVDQGENTYTWKRRRAHLQPRSRPSKRVTSIDSLDPVMLFVNPLDSGKLATAGIIPPSDPRCTNGTSASAQLQPYRFHGRVGRGGRIIFDRWNPLTRTPIGAPDSSHPPPQSLDTEKESDFPKNGGGLNNESTTMR